MFGKSFSIISVTREKTALPTKFATLILGLYLTNILPAIDDVREKEDSFSFQVEKSVRLEPGTTVEGKVEIDKKQTYLLDFPAHQFVYGELDQSEVDAVITIFSPEGEQIGRFDASGSLERIHLETADSGTYRIEVTLARGNAGRYVFRIMPTEELGETPDKRIDQLLKAYYRDDEPGGVINVFVDGKVVYSKAIGLANLTHRIPFTLETGANIASNSKQFTAFAVALLEKEGKISIKDDVRKYLPDLSEYGTPITLLHLLEHTSGYRGIFKTFPMKGVRGSWLRNELIDSVRKQQQLNNPPGSEYQYSNTGYILLAEVIEKVTQTPFSEWMGSNVFAPLDMKNTVIKTTPGQVIPNSAQGYKRGGKGFTQQTDTPALYGASGIYSTVGDLTKWLQNFHDARVGGRKIISQMTESDSLFGGDTNYYSFGLEIERDRGLLRYSHGGNDGGISSKMDYYPELNGGLIQLFNGRSWPVVWEKVTEEFFSMYMTEPDVGEKEKEKPDAIEIDATLLPAYVGRYGGAANSPLLISFELEGSRLRAETNNPNLPSFFHLRPLSNTTFVEENLDIMVTFHSDTNGQVPLLTFRWLGEDSTFQRLPPWKPSNQDLQAYAGLYYSPELEMVYSIIVDNTQLKLKHPLMEFNLVPKIPDSFLGPWLGEYQFKRTNDGTLFGFIVQSVIFEKLK